MGLTLGVTMTKKELEAENKILKEALNGTYDALCDVVFIVSHDMLDLDGRQILNEAVIEINKIATNNEWYKNKLIEVDAEFGGVL